MDGFNFGAFGPPKKGKNKRSNSIDFGVKFPKQDSLNFGMQSPKNAERDSRRKFTPSQEREILHQQNNKCAKCKKPLDMRTYEIDHKKPWADAGRTITQNGRALHAECHKLITHNARLKKVDRSRKSVKEDPYKFF